MTIKIFFLRGILIIDNNGGMVSKGRRMLVYKLIFVLIIVVLLVFGTTFDFWTWTSDINKNVVFTMVDLEDYV